MSIAEKIQSLTAARTAIQNAITAKGGAITAADGFEDFATAIAAIPSGGGGGGSTGAMQIASGTFTPSASDNSQTINIGNKMAQTDFILIVYADNSEILPYDSVYKGVLGVLVCDRIYGSFDLSTTYDKTPTQNRTYRYYDNSGNIQERSLMGVQGGSFYIRQATAGGYSIDNNTHNKIRKRSTGVEVTMRWSGQYFVSGTKYYYKILYYGTDPTNDIVEVEAAS